MVVKDDKNLLGECDYQNTLKTSQNVDNCEPEILPVGPIDEDCPLMNHLAQYKTPKSQKIKSSCEMKRWASVVKASKNYQQLDGTSINNDQIKNEVKKPETIESLFKLLPKNVEAQKGFIVSRNTSYFCVPCTFELDSVIGIANHLKTRKHEDCIISYLKDKLPPQMDSIMEYVSFLGFNLCCNLCRCSIDMSSYNPYETIVNIVGHNACKIHIAQKATCNAYKDDLTQIDDLVTNKYAVESSTKVDKNITSSTHQDEFQLELDESVSEKKALKRTFALNNKPVVDVPEKQSTTQDKHSRLKDLLSSIPSGLLNIDCIVENDKGSITCLICNRVVPPSSHNLYTHLVGSNHKKNRDKSNITGIKENTKQNEDDFTELKHSNHNNVYESDIVKKIPVHLRSIKIHSVQIMTSKDVDSYFEQMMIKNPLILENDSFLVRNVDGKNSYCKLCRNLTPLSTDLSVLENTIIEHLKSEKHITKFSKMVSQSSKQKSGKALRVGSGRVSRSLFALSEDNIETDNDLEGTEINYYINEKQEPTNGLDHSAQLCAASLLKKENGDVLLAKTSTPKTLQIKKIRYLKVETEQDEEVLSRRQKQIGYGKNTAGYSRYCQLVPRGQRGPRNPVTPPRHVKCSRRTWDGMVRAWRRQLHMWDPPQPPTLDSFPWLTVLPSN